MAPISTASAMPATSPRVHSEALADWLARVVTSRRTGKVPPVHRVDRQGRYTDALRVMKRIDMTNFFWTHVHYAMIYAQLGQPEKARAALARTVELMPDFAERPEDIIRMEIRDEEVIEKMLSGLRKAGLNT